MKNLVNYLDDYMEDDFEFESCHHKINPDTKDALKAVHKANREEEFAAHGKSINYNKTFKNRKAYSRKDKHVKRDYTE